MVNLTHDIASRQAALQAEKQELSKQLKTQIRDIERLANVMRKAASPRVFSGIRGSTPTSRESRRLLRMFSPASPEFFSGIGRSTPTSRETRRLLQMFLQHPQSFLRGKRLIPRETSRGVSSSPRPAAPRSP